MTDQEIELFLDRIYTGEDLEFEYKGRQFLAQGYWNEKLKMGHNDVCEYVEGADPFYPLSIDACNADRIKIFENAAIFDGKTFWEVAEDIKWLW